MEENELRNRKDRKKRKKREIERKEEGRKGGPASTGLQCSNNKRFDRSGSELVYTPRGRGSLLVWLFLV